MRKLASFGFELRHLLYVLPVADHRSFRRAAAALGVHQSALSRRLRDFGDRVGISLFERGRDSARPAIAGEALLTDIIAAEIIENLEAALEQFRGVAEDLGVSE